MEFGKLDDLSNVDWSLPPNDKLSLHYLEKNDAIKANWYLGTPTWGSRTWLGKIYPDGTKSSDFLHHYSRAFSTIELNTTHYRLPTRELVKSWCDQVPAHFRFCPKFPQTISHSNNGLIDTNLMQEWHRALRDFGSKLGVSFIQFPPYFDYSSRAILHHFLEAWPSDLPLALEFRHPSWFQHGSVIPALVNYLQSKNIGLVITDVAGRRDVLHTSISAPFVLLRFIGNELHPSDFERAQAWGERLHQWTQAGLQSVYFFAHEPDDITCPELADYLVKEFNKNFNLDWPAPIIQKQQQATLF